MVVLVGELDSGVEPLARAELDRASDARILVVDLRGLTFMDSSGIHLLLAVRDRCAAIDTPLFVVRGPACVHRGLEALGLHRRFAIVDHPDVADLVTA
jgi:anti-anti-sigma factor